MKATFIEFQRIRLRNKLVYWTLNVSIAFLFGLLCSLFFESDREKILIIIGSVITDILVISLLGGYNQEKKKFESGNLNNLKNRV